MVIRHDIDRGEGVELESDRGAIIKMGARFALQPRDAEVDLVGEEEFIRQTEADRREVSVIELIETRSLATELGTSVTIPGGNCCAVLNALLSARNVSRAPGIFNVAEFMVRDEGRTSSGHLDRTMAKIALSQIAKTLEKAGFPQLFFVHTEGFILLADFVVVDRRFSQVEEAVTEISQTLATLGEIVDRTDAPSVEIEKTRTISKPTPPIAPSWVGNGSEGLRKSVEDSFLGHLANGSEWFFTDDILDDKDLTGRLFALLEETIASSDYTNRQNGVRERCNLAHRTLYRIVHSATNIPPGNTNVIKPINNSNDLADGAETTDWSDRGNCQGVDPDLFFPERGASTREAREVCRGCVVRSECLEYALVNGEKFGIWGGLSERERRRLRRQRSQGTRRTQA